MIGKLMGILPSGSILMCAFLAAFVPMVIYKINRALHKHGDPPWKKE